MPFTVWITGLPASGKTTIGRILANRLEAILLDGDLFRKSVSKGLGFSPEERMENLKRASMVAKFLNESDRNVVACFITPYQRIRNDIRKTIDNLILVYAKCSLQECMRRDVKGLYNRAMRGEIDNLTGYSAPYEEPESPDVITRTDEDSVEESVNKVLSFLDRKGFWKIKATLFIGRFSPPHKGHKYLFDSILNNEGRIAIAIRDTPLSKENPYTALQRKTMLEKMYENNPDVKVMIIPDIDTVCIGRGVGYRIMKAPESIEIISATEIRKKGKYENIPEEIVDLVKEYDKQNRSKLPSTPRDAL